MESLQDCEELRPHAKVGEEHRTRIKTPAGAWRESLRAAPQEARLSAKPEKCEKAMSPFLVTVMGAGGKLLLNVVENGRNQREIKIFCNTGRVDDGLQITRSCLRNMLSVEFNEMVCVNAFKGYYLAVQTTHTDQNTRWYATVHRYKSNIGNLSYVAVQDIGQFASDHGARIGAKIIDYLDEVEKYIKVCCDIARAARPEL